MRTISGCQTAQATIAPTLMIPMFIMVHNEPGKALIETGVPDHVYTVSAVRDGEVVAPDRLPVQQHIEVPGARGGSQIIPAAGRRGQQAGAKRDRARQTVVARKPEAPRVSWESSTDRPGDWMQPCE